MIYYKKCALGHKNTYKSPMEAPLYCEICGRSIAGVTVETEDETMPNAEKSTTENGMCLIFPDGSVLPFSESITVGRNSKGAEYLENYSEISRKHFIITPRIAGLSAKITDISLYGTSVNGKKLEKNKPRIILDKAEIQLVNSVKITLSIKGEESEK